MAHGFIIESNIQAKDIDALNRHVVSTEDVDGGAFLALTAPTVQGSDVFTAKAPEGGKLGGLWIAYNPSPKYLSVEGKVFAGLSADVRDYANVKNKTFNAFKPKVGDELIYPVDAITGAEAIVAGDFVEAVAGTSKPSRVAKATGATADSTAFEVEWVGVQPFPQAGIGMENVKVVRMVCTQE